MCQICKEWQNKEITSVQAFRKITELLSNTQDMKIVSHLQELSDTIIDSEIPVAETDEAIDQEWWESVHQERDSELG